MTRATWAWSLLKHPKDETPSYSEGCLLMKQTQSLCFLHINDLRIHCNCSVYGIIAWSLSYYQCVLQLDSYSPALKIFLNLPSRKHLLQLHLLIYIPLLPLFFQSIMSCIIDCVVPTVFFLSIPNEISFVTVSPHSRSSWDMSFSVSASYVVVSKITWEREREKLDWSSVI
jgi:hypothetical protein